MPLSLCLVTAFGPACDDDLEPRSQVEVESTDTGEGSDANDATGGGEDTSTPDTEAVDATTTDTSPADTTPADTTPADTSPADTSPADTTPADTTPADTTPADTAVTQDTTPADTQDTAEVETTPECADDARCEALLGGDTCNEARCLDGRCAMVTANDGAPCSDGDRCSTGDTCRAGICEAGDGVLACPPLSAADACFVPICAPGSGCGKVPAPAGTACDNGGGPAPGSCQPGGYQAPDVCDGRGDCVDVLEPAADPGAPALAGDWLAVRTTFGRYAAPATARAVLDVDVADHTFVVRAARAIGISPFWDGAEGHFCTADDGGIEGYLSGGRMSGHQVDERLALVSDPGGDGLTVLLRADLGSSIQVSGRYRYFQTTLVFGATTPTTWRGTVEFSSGCLTSGSIVTDPTVAGQYDFVTAPGGDCLNASTTAGEASLYRLATKSRAHTGDPTSYPIDLRGAIGEGGDILLMVKEQHTGAPSMTPEYGVVILVREPAAGAITEASLAGTWAYGLHTKLGGDLPRRDLGTLTWAANGSVGTGTVQTLEGDKPLGGGWFDFDAAARKLSQRLSMAGLDLFHSGVVDRSGRFAVGWNVAPPANPNTMTVLGDVPRYGSMLLMLRLDE